MPPRHSRVYLSREAWAAWLGTRDAWRDEPIVRDWVALGRPLIARRPASCDSCAAAPDASASEGGPSGPGASAGPLVHLGLPLPPAAGKRRIAVVVPADAVVGVAPPPELASLRDVAPPAWRATLDALDALARRHRVRVRAFGSLAWQGVTGLPYLHAESDLDMLLDPPPDAADRPAALAALMADVAACEAGAPMRIDGEVWRADGAGANWRELHAGAAEIAVKTAGAIELISIREFLDPNREGTS